MNDSLYKTFIASRGVKYSYFASEASEDKPYVVFVHGFPSYSRDWYQQVPAFQAHGYGLIIPDMLGCGNSDKPEGIEDYLMSKLTGDLVELLDQEEVMEVVAVGHDWGSAFLSTLAARFQERFLGFAFLSISYGPPNPAFEYYQALEMFRATIGSEIFGYWDFFNEDDSSATIIDHFDSAYSIIFPQDPSLWEKHIAPKGALKEWIINDKVTPVAGYVPENDRIQRKHLFEDSKLAALNWYRVQVRGFAAKDDADIPKDQYVIKRPVFFGAAKNDCIAKPDMGKFITQQFCKNAKVVEFDTAHWIMMEMPDRLNEELLQWIKSL